MKKHQEAPRGGQTTESFNNTDIVCTNINRLLSPNITHICCCGVVITHELYPGIKIDCMNCGASWIKTTEDTLLRSFGNISCLDCYFHEFRYNKISTQESQISYIKSHCRHARGLLMEME